MVMENWVGEYRGVSPPTPPQRSESTSTQSDSPSLPPVPYLRSQPSPPTPSNGGRFVIVNECGNPIVASKSSYLTPPPKLYVPAAHSLHCCVSMSTYLPGSQVN